MKYYVEWKLRDGKAQRTEGSMLKKDAELIEALFVNYVQIDWVEVREEKVTS